MIERKDLFHLSFYKKKRFTGSYQGMRYLITRTKASGEEDAPDVLRAIVYPEPYNFEHTPDEDKTPCDFPFSEEGLDMACAWLNEQHERSFRNGRLSESDSHALRQSERNGKNQ